MFLNYGAAGRGAMAGRYRETKGDHDAHDGYGRMVDYSLPQGMAERALKAVGSLAHQDWEDAFNAITDAITIHDGAFNIIYANRAAEKMLGLPPGRAMEAKCYKYYHGTDDTPRRCPSCRSLKDRRPATYEIFEPYLNKSLEIRTMPRFDRNSRLIGMIHIVRDITDRKKSEEEKVLLESQLLHLQKVQALGILTGGITHDFNNILTAISGYADLMRTDLVEGSHLSAYAENILAASERASYLTQRLLVFSRKEPVEPKPVNLNEVVERAGELLGRIIGEDIELEISLAGSDLTVMADAGQIEQVLMNLATNARDAMPDGGVLTMHTERAQAEEDILDRHIHGKPGAYALISVADNGSGMDEEIRGKIFEPFFTTKRAGKGTGLGLSIVYGIVRQYDGHIHVYSEPGKGTAFKIYLPLLTSDPGARTVDCAPGINPGAGCLQPGTGETVLVAEDSIDAREFIRSVLRGSGYKVIDAVDGEDAVKKFVENDNDVQLLILDVIMPKRDGREVYEDIRRTRPDVKVIFTSGYSEDVIRRKGILEEKTDLLQKPFSPKELLRRVREALAG